MTMCDTALWRAVFRSFLLMCSEARAEGGGGGKGRKTLQCNPLRAVQLCTREPQLF